MSLVDASIDCVHQRIKRKLDDYGPADDEDFTSDLVSVRMRKVDHFAAVNSSITQLDDARQFEPRVSDDAASSSFTKLHFFVRTITKSKTLVIHANSDDTVKSVLERIQYITGYPVTEQRLIYRGKQLRWEQTLADCLIENDVGLQLIGRMQSTKYPEAWQVIDQMVSSICRMCKGERVCSENAVKAKLAKFLSKTPQDSPERAEDHLEIFISACAPTALVMLYSSPNKGNKNCAENLIRQFITSISVFPKNIHPLCAPILLEFCKLLRRNSEDDPMYKLCRSSLGSMVEYIGIGRSIGSKSSESIRALITFEDICLFVSELSAKLIYELTVTVESETAEERPLLNDVNDFIAYLLPLRTAMKDQVSDKSPILLPQKLVGYNMPCYGEEIKILYCIYVDLMEKMYLCLGRVEEWLARKEKGEGEILRLGWCHYLSILKELNSISKLFHGAEKEFWEKLRHRKDSICSLILKYAKRSDDHRWILEHKEVTNFDCRRHLAMMLLPEVKDDYEELHEMLIDRSQLLAESFEYIARAETETLRAGLFLEFKNEEATGPGVLREWFCLVCQEIFNPQNALFVACPNDRRRFFPNPASKVHPLHLEYFTFTGRVIALALMHKVQVGIVFDRIFFLQLAGMKVSLEDIRDADPYLYSSCKKILEMDPETVDQDALGLTFVREVDELGSIKVEELCFDGRNIPVNSRNRKKYVDLLIQHRFVTSISEQVTHFARGFSDIMHPLRFVKFFFQSLEIEDFDWILCGRESTISVEDWKAHTEYNGYKEDDPQISWLWKSIGEMSAEQRKILLFFWTSVKYLPIEGFSGLASKLYIYKSTETHDRLPSSHTCFYRLCFPPYQSLNVLQDRLRVITQEHVGCSFGTW